MDTTSGKGAGSWALSRLLLGPLKTFKEEGGNINMGASWKNEALEKSGSSVPCGISFLTGKARSCQSIMSEINDPQSSKANVSQTWAGPI